jgi:hypothetical protein
METQAAAHASYSSILIAAALVSLSSARFALRHTADLSRGFSGESHPCLSGVYLPVRKLSIGLTPAVAASTPLYQDK